MRRLTILAALAGALTLAQHAHAANCRTIRCANRAITALQREVHIQRVAIHSLYACMAEFPANEYGGYSAVDPAGNPTTTTAVDVTAPGDTIQAWVLLDSCNRTTVRPAATRRLAPAPFIPLAPFAVR